MHFTDCLSKLKTALTKPLPGWEAQIRMAPEMRMNVERNAFYRDDHRESSVMILCYPNVDDKAHLALIQRPEYGGVHSGQVSFPGGAREANEPLEQTARRETEEEIGVPAQAMTVLGNLTEVYIPPSNFMVYPYVSYLSEPPVFYPDQREVAGIIEVPLPDLTNPVYREVNTIHIRRVGQTPVPMFNFNGRKVWGATAMILSEFAEMLQL